jgi:hypothetical protein
MIAGIPCIQSALFFSKMQFLLKVENRLIQISEVEVSIA